MTKFLVAFLGIGLLNGAHTDGDWVSVPGRLVGTEGIDINYDGIADFIGQNGFAGYMVSFVGETDSNCNIRKGIMLDVDWEAIPSLSVGSCPLSTGGVNEGYGKIQSDGTMVYTRGNSVYRYSLRNGSDFFTRSSVSAKVEGFYRSTGSIDTIGDSKGDLYIAGGSLDFEYLTCDLMSGSYNKLDCGDTRDGVLDYTGSLGVSFVLISKEGPGCVLYNDSTGKGPIAWGLNSNRCPFDLNSRVEEPCSLTANGMLLVAGATFYQAPTSTFFSKARTVTVFGNLLQNGDLDADHNGTPDIIPARLPTTTAPTTSPTTRTSTTRQNAPIGTGPLLHTPAQRVTLQGSLFSPNGVDITGDGIVDFTTGPDYFGLSLEFPGVIDQLCRILDDPISRNVAWTLDLAKSSGSCNTPSESFGKVTGTLRPDGTMSVNSTAVYKRNLGFDFYGNLGASIVGVINGTYLADGSIDTTNDGRADIQPLIPNSDFQYIRCEVMSLTTTELDCGSARDGRPDYRGMKGLRYLLTGYARSDCTVISKDAQNQDMNWSLDTGYACTIGSNRYVSEYGTFTSAGKLKIGPSQFTANKDDLGGVKVILYGTLLSNGDIDIDHDGSPDSVRINGAQVYGTASMAVLLISMMIIN